jgi:hypothetical protein
MHGVRYLGAMHVLFALLLLPFSSQLLPAKPTVQHVTVAATVVARDGALTLQLDVTPKERIHVYGPGATDFLQPSLTLAPVNGLKPGAAKFPPPELVLDPILKERIPMYTKTFRVVLPATPAKGAKADEPLTIAGALSYQACDDKLCYAPSMLPVSWVVRAVK